MLSRARENLEANECAEVARQVRILLDRSGLGQHEFASRIGVPKEQFAAYLGGHVSPPASLMVRMRRLSDRFTKMRAQRPRQLTTYALIPGAGGSAWYWHRVMPLLVEHGAEAIAIDLPADDDSADLTAYTEIVCRATEGASGPVILVGQSMGAFTAPMVAERVDTALIVLVNPMVPTPGETPGQWWEATGQPAARVDYFKRIGLAAHRV